MNEAKHFVKINFCKDYWLVSQFEKNHAEDTENAGRICLYPQRHLSRHWRDETDPLPIIAA
jgi:hypothetical protein